jgi:DNA-binding transcriptional LysR family regulator
LPWATWGDDLAQLPTFKWLENHAPKALRVLRSNSLGAQLVAAQAGAAAVLTSDIAAARFGLVPLRAAAALRSDLAELPADELWLIGHRALRNVPRIAAVWDFLLQQFSAYTRPRA